MPDGRRSGSSARRGAKENGDHATGPNSPITQWQCCCQVATTCCLHPVHSLDAIGAVVGKSAPMVRKRLNMLQKIGIWIDPNPEGRITVVRFEPKVLPIGRDHT